MLRIAKLTDYATGLITRLAHQPRRWVSAQQLAVELGLPAPTVARLLKLLNRAGLVVSQRGKGGGYGLARPADEISIAEVIAAIEGPVALTECALGNGRCARERDCDTRANWRKISQVVKMALETVSLADMAASRHSTVQFSSQHHQPRKG